MHTFMSALTISYLKNYGEKGAYNACRTTAFCAQLGITQFLFVQPAVVYRYGKRKQFPAQSRWRLFLKLSSVLPNGNNIMIYLYSGDHFHQDRF
jgi:hypothetical protein